MFDPITIAAVIAAGKLGQKIFGGSGTAKSDASLKCRWCGNTITGTVSTTTCCHKALCQTCVPKWREAGGSNCVMCNG